MTRPCPMAGKPIAYDAQAALKHGPAPIVSSLRRTLREWPTCLHGGTLAPHVDAGTPATVYYTRAPSVTWRCSFCGDGT